jgi:hypothetical protein
MKIDGSQEQLESFWDIHLHRNKVNPNIDQCLRCPIAGQSLLSTMGAMVKRCPPVSSNQLAGLPYHNTSTRQTHRQHPRVAATQTTQRQCCQIVEFSRVKFVECLPWGFIGARACLGCLRMPVVHSLCISEGLSTGDASFTFLPV